VPAGTATGEALGAAETCRSGRSARASPRPRTGGGFGGALAALPSCDADDAGDADGKQNSSAAIDMPSIPITRRMVTNVLVPAIKGKESSHRLTRLELTEVLSNHGQELAQPPHICRRSGSEDILGAHTDRTLRTGYTEHVSDPTSVFSMTPFFVVLGLSIGLGAASPTAQHSGFLVGQTKIRVGCPVPVQGAPAPQCDPWHPLPFARFSVRRTGSSGQPLPGIVRLVVSRASGRFSVQLGPGSYLVTALPQSHARPSNSQTVTIRAGKTSRVVVRFLANPPTP